MTIRTHSRLIFHLHSDFRLIKWIVYIYNMPLCKIIELNINNTENKQNNNFLITDRLNLVIVGLEDQKAPPSYKLEGQDEPDVCVQASYSSV